MRRPSVAVTGSVLAVLVAGGGLLAWYGRQRVARFYTDALSIRVPEAQARIRDVIWEASAPLRDNVNTPADEFEPSLAPDGSTMLFVRGRTAHNTDIYVSRRSGAGWTDPRPLAAINTPADELGPVTGPDRAIWFYSNRAGGFGGYDLWVAPPAGEGWGEPVNLGPNVNGPFNEFAPAISGNGATLYFASDRPGTASAPPAGGRRASPGDSNVWFAALDGTAPEPARPADALNTAANDGAPAVSPYGDFIYFASDRGGGAGGYDLYRARRLEDGFAAPEHLGETVNSPADELDPSVASGGFELLFSSNRARADGGGGYDLYRAASREVFAETETYRATVDWALIGRFLLYVLLTAVLIVAMIKMPERHRRLTLLARCVIGSLLVHAAFLLLFSAWQVTTSLVGALREGGGTRVVIESSSAGHALARQLRGATGPATAAPSIDVPSPRRSTAVTDETPPPHPRHVAVARATVEATIDLEPETEAEDATPVAARERVTVASRAVTPRRVEEVRLPAYVQPQRPAAEAPAPSPAPPPRDERHEPAPTPPVVPEPAVRVEVTPAAVVRTDSVPRLAPPPTASAPPAPAAPPALAAASAVVPPEAARPLEVRMPVAAADGPHAQTAATAEPPLRTAALPGSATPTARELEPVTEPARERTLRLAPPSTGPLAGDGSFALPSTPAAPAPAARAVARVNPAAPAVPAAAAALALPTAAGASQAKAHERPAAAPAHPTDETGRYRRHPALDRPAPQVAIALAPAAAPLAVRTLLETPPPPPARERDLEPFPDRPAPPPAAGQDRGTDLAEPPRLEAPAMAARPVPAPEPEPQLSASPRRPLDPGALADRRPTPPARRRADPVVEARPEPAESLAEVLVHDVPLVLEIAMADPAEVGFRPLLDRDITSMRDRLPDINAPAEMQYLQRSEPLRRQRIDELGGSRKTEKAVALALEWLAAHQSDDGHWDSRKFDENCGACSGAATVDADIALTGLSLLAFLTADNTPAREGPYREVVDRGLTWLIDRQDEQGSWIAHESMYSQGIATMAIAEALGMTEDTRFIEPVQRSIAFIYAARNATFGGWRYKPGQIGDTSVLGWQVMALKAAERAGVKLPEGALAVAAAWLHKVRDGSNPGLYAYQPGQNTTPAMTAESMFVQELLGVPHDAPHMKNSADYIAGFLPRWKYSTTYFWYYATLALYQYGGEQWTRWNTAVKEQLLAHQVTEGEAAGSWIPHDKWATAGGRVYQTALCTLTLEVYYRYLPLYVEDQVRREWLRQAISEGGE